MDDYEELQIPLEKPKVSYWRKMGGGSLGISIIIHAIILGLGLIWIVQSIPPPKEKIVDFMPAGGGGGAPSQSPSKQKQRQNMVRNNASRVAAKDVVSNFTLPDPEVSSDMSALGALGAGGLSGGLGGPGSGGGKGGGTGTGFGDGMGPGIGVGTGTMSPFGMVDPNANALVGTFYDFKQDTKRKPTDMGVKPDEVDGRSGTPDKVMREKIREIVKRGFKERDLDDYFEAPQKLYQSKVFIPVMAAKEAPAAFDCEKEVMPRRWAVAYRGQVQAPKAGKFRFVGAGDDLLVVRFNNKTVFDHGYTLGTAGHEIYKRFSDLAGETETDKVLIKDVRDDSPMKIPITFYTYADTPGLNTEIGGFAVGPEFDVKAGTTYPIEILIGEIPGGRFSVFLMIQEEGVEYPKDSTGSPILPIFRTDNSLPDPNAQGEMPPFDPKGPIWKAVKGGKLDL